MSRYATDCLAKTQPDFGPNHIKNINELGPGTLIIFCNISDIEEPRIYEVVGIKRDNGEVLLECKSSNGKTERSLADWGVISYRRGIYKRFFNQLNHIERFEIPDIYPY